MKITGKWQTFESNISHFGDKQIFSWIQKLPALQWEIQHIETDLSVGKSAVQAIAKIGDDFKQIAGMDEHSLIAMSAMKTNYLKLCQLKKEVLEIEENLKKIGLEIHKR